MKTDILAILEGRVNPARTGIPRMPLFEMKRGEHSLVFQLVERISHSGDVVADHAVGALVRYPFPKPLGYQLRLGQIRLEQVPDDASGLAVHPDDTMVPVDPFDQHPVEFLDSGLDTG